MPDDSGFDPRDALTPLRRALGVRRMALWVGRGISIGAALAAVVLLTRRLAVFPAAAPLSAATVIAGGLIALILGFTHWPSILEAARTADSRFSLDDRLTTALEFRESRDPLIDLQRRDVAHRIRGLRLEESARWSITRAELGVAGLVALLLVVALLLPAASNPRPAAANPAQQNLNAARQAALAQVRAIRRSFSASLEPQARRSSVTKRSLAALSHLEQQIRRARTEAQALRAISSTQQQLQRLSSALRPVGGKSANTFAKTMRPYMTKQESANTRKGTKARNSSASQFLRRMANSASTQTPAQRKRNARALQTAANRIQNAGLKSDLSQAASALGHNDLKTATKALQQAARRFRNSSNAQATKGHIGAVNKKLDSLKNRVSGLHHKRSSGTGRTALKGSRRNAAQTGKQLRDTVGTAPSSNLKQARGKSLVTRAPSGSSERSAGGTGHTGSGNSNSSAVVYVPGLVGQRQRLLPVNLHGTSKPVPVVPYQQVIARYRSSARSALDRSALPPSLQQYVRRYFTTLSKQ